MEFYPLTMERWDDFEELFGARGAYGGCWCMWWRSTRREFEARQGEGNRLAMKGIVESGKVPGIIGYTEGVPTAWCSIAPRDDYPSLNRSRVLKKIDDTPVWSLVCFFVDKSCRGRGYTGTLIKAAIEYVKERGGRVVEAYPSVPKSKRVPPVSSFMGFPEGFRELGFKVIAKPSPSKRVLRYIID